MKMLINGTKTILEESLDGFAAAHADILLLSAERKFVRRRGLLLAFAATAGNPVAAPDRPDKGSRRCHIGASEELVTSFLCDPVQGSR
jgi:hypothetical protein